MIGCIVQARMGSNRLPGKIMMTLDGKNPVLYFVLKQLQSCKELDKIVVATTTLEEDDVIVKYVNDFGLTCFRGNEKDVLDRHYQCAKKFSFSTIVRMPSDKPLLDPGIVDKVVEIFKTKLYDYVSTVLPPTFPSGTEVEVFSFQALQDAWNNASLPSEREHVTPYIYNHRDKFRIFNIENSENISHFRWAVDRKEDLILVRQIIAKIKKKPILMKDILSLFSKEPELIEINKKYSLTDEGYLKSLKEDKEYLKSKKL